MNSDFRENVYRIVSAIPLGMVMTYGDIAALCGHAYAARVVGGIAHFGPPNLPWHRVVNRNGGLARGFPGGIDAQVELLRAEGHVIENYTIEDFKEKRWTP